MAQDTHYIVCFCEECCEEFKSFIAKDLCPICEKIIGKYETVKFNKDIQKIKRSKREEY
jgi:hypothetical protein